MDEAQIRVQVCYATPGANLLQAVTLAAGSTLGQAIEQSGILAQAPEIELASCKVGIFSRPRQLDTVLREGDRVEIYRPLLADPKTARRERAAQKRGGKKAMSA